MIEERYPELHPILDEHGVLELVLNDAAKLNAVDGALHRALANVWRDVDADPRVRAVLLRAEGRAFSAGGDLAWVEQLAIDFEARARGFREARDLVYNIVNCSKPTVSAINGVAVGAGLALALLTDISIAGRSARFIDGHTKLGVAAGDHAVLAWPILCGLARARYYLLLCERLDGATAAEIGLVALCVEDDELLARAREAAHRLATGSATAIRWTKQSLNHWLRMAGPAFEASLAAEFLGFSGPDVHEGLAAIREKRDPRFTGPSDD
ncbi:enoyl-CoA hydratase/isomerase family protein [Sphingomonas sp.]|uniref:enoyl-CoA hydratase/isomerase family protein n=1 Tax=Sphingomonas sp. TaxID=28214 RepID=UPI002DB6F3A9|nr:enoyl-CoA hydratase/isomerase family protein [Sphingomonas sp.]HEU4969545.1 enoyl-CoA hydratase/isomerase family protein [Sphingomonas sp.]